jgi:hypothetical protein
LSLQLFGAVVDELDDQGAQNELYSDMMDTVTSIDPSRVAKNTKLLQAVEEKLQNEPQRLTDVMDILEANVSNDFLKGGIQSLKKRHADLLGQLESQENQEDNTGIALILHMYSTVG